MLNTNNTQRIAFLCIIALTFFTFDIGQFFLYGTLMMPLLICLYYTLIFVNTWYSFLYFIIFLQCLESFCFYSFFTFPLFSTIPFTVIAFILQKNLYYSPLYGILFSLCTIIFNAYFLERSLIPSAPLTYTLMKISSTLILSICFSLTITKWGKARQSRTK